MKRGLQQTPRQRHQAVFPSSALTSASLGSCKRQRLGSASGQQLATGLQHALTAHLQIVKQSCADKQLVPGRGSSRLRAQDQDAEQTYKRTAEKALEVNLNPLWYGTFAEIGAGQEVARWFFRVGAAAGTIAKSVSAYDMTISDSMYGAAERYVTRERVAAMLDYEYLQCDLTLRKQRGADTAFFAFSDTVVAKAFGRDNECHGWLGIKYQDSPRSQPSSIMIHIRMLDSTAQLQQEALGVLGVNFIHAALTMGSDVSKIIASLFSDLTRSRMEVDLIDFGGPAFVDTDNRVAALRLVQLGLTDAALFDPAGDPRIPMEVLYKKNVLLTRGRFRPFTSLHNDMLMGAASQYFCEGQEEEEIVSLQNDECVFREDTVVLLEMTTRDMMEGGDLLDWTSDKGIQEDAFLQRIEALSTMGYSVMLSSFRRFFALAAYISTFTRQSIVLAMGIPSLARLFDESFYSDLNGGILEGFGRLLRFNLKIYVYPTLDEKTGELITAKNCKVEPSVQLLYDYILSRGTIVPINDYDERLLRHGDVGHYVNESIRQGTREWEDLVPSAVKAQIKSHKLLGYKGEAKDQHASNGANGAGKKELPAAHAKARVASAA